VSWNTIVRWIAVVEEIQRMRSEVAVRQVGKQELAIRPLSENLAKTCLGGWEIDIECESQLGNQDLASVNEHMLLGV